VPTQRLRSKKVNKNTPPGNRVDLHSCAGRLHAFVEPRAYRRDVPGSETTRPARFRIRGKATLGATGRIELERRVVRFAYREGCKTLRFEARTEIMARIKTPARMRGEKGMHAYSALKSGAHLGERASAGGPEDIFAGRCAPEGRLRLGRKEARFWWRRSTATMTWRKRWPAFGGL
jgi:hypothetical protein